MESLYFNIAFTFCFIVLLAISKILRSKDNVPESELFFQSSSKFIKNVISKCPSLQEIIFLMYAC